MQIDPFTFAAQIVNFLILLFLLRRFLYRPVMAAMDRREQGISDRLGEARRKMREAEEKEEQYRRNLRELEHDRKEMMEEAREETVKSRSEWLNEAREEVRAIRERWQESLRQEKEGFLRELKEAAGERLLEVVRQILNDLSTRGLEEQAAEVFLEKLEGLEADDRRMLSEYTAAEGAEEIVITGSFEPAPETRERIRALFRDCLGEDMPVRFETDSTQGIGLEARVGGWRLGWNMNRYLRTLASDMEAYLNREMPGGAPASGQE